MTTPLLGLPEIIDSQAGKSYVHNEALHQIEGLTIRILSRTVTAEPGSPAEGDTYYVPSGATGSNWSINTGKIGHYYGSAWHFYTLKEGYSFWVNDEDVTVVFDGSALVQQAGTLDYAEYDHGSIGSGTINLVWSTARTQVVTLTGNITIDAPSVPG